MNLLHLWTIILKVRMKLRTKNKKCLNKAYKNYVNFKFKSCRPDLYMKSSQNSINLFHQINAILTAFHDFTPFF